MYIVDKGDFHPKYVLLRDACIHLSVSIYVYKCEAQHAETCTV